MTGSQIEYFDNNHLVKDPLVSVVMITYNHERFLAEAIEGVVRQDTCFPFELLIGEDCSTDGTKEIALSYQKQFPEIVRVITSEQNVGMHENFSRLVKAARGEYIAFCEGDDYWCRLDKLELQISILESNPSISLVCSSWRTISEDGDLINPDTLSLEKGRGHYLGLDDIMQLARIRTLTVCTRTALVKVAMRDSPLCRLGRYPMADHPLWVALSQFGVCQCMPDVYSAYRVSEGSATRPSDPMNAYKFLAGSGEFERDVLDLYELPQGKEATMLLKISATRRRLRALALLGNSVAVQHELQKLELYNVRIKMTDRLLYVLSTIVSPETLGAAVVKFSIHLWRALRYGKWPKRKSGL
jgi:glycosyltransferase involved in cell wall biosynthesis